MYMYMYMIDDRYRDIQWVKNSLKHGTTYIEKLDIYQNVYNDG